ncbi:MAG TPA: peptidylprolyl isomerase [Puia sp.]|nr:peptidylprolyl isomerase [Puia sp.]
MKHLFIIGISLLFSSLMTRAQSKTQNQPPAQGQQRQLTPAQEAEMIAQMQAQAKKFTVPQIKSELEKSPNPVLYAKQILQKRFTIDTIVVTKTRGFNSLADSLAYNGKEKKVYGPYGDKSGRFLVQILTKAPNEFYHVGQIFIDTSVFRRRIADSIGDKILGRIKNGSATFEEMAQSYSMGGEAATKGDLGWIARGVLLPQIEHEIANRKKGEVFKIWSPSGLHIIRKTDDPRKDTGFALMMRVFL